MDKDTLVQRLGTNLPIVLAVAVISIVMSELGKWSVEREHAATPRILSGRATALSADNRLGCCSREERSSGGQSFSVASVRWRDLKDGPDWHDEGVPSCLSRTRPNMVRMGVVQMKNRGGGPPIDVAGWVECQ